MIIPVITGPTASGKTALAFELAEKFNIEFVSADAYQVYKYMNIGTAKPTEKELSIVKHHLIDFLEPDNTYSAGDFFNHAEKKIKDILARNKLPLILGGTGLYVETLKKGIFNGPPRDDILRSSLKKVISKRGLSFLYSYLEKIDEDYALKISENDSQRIIRAIEVYKKTSLNFTDAQKQLHKKPKFNYEIFVLDMPRDELYEKINKRVISMIDAGWIDEVQQLLSLGYSNDLPSFKAIGYREITEYLQNNIEFEDLIYIIQKKTRNFAKRQLTWFRHMDYAIKLNIKEYGKDKLFEYFKKYYQFYLK